MDEESNTEEEWANLHKNTQEVNVRSSQTIWTLSTKLYYLHSKDLLVLDQNAGLIVTHGGIIGVGAEEMAKAHHTLIWLKNCRVVLT